MRIREGLADISVPDDVFYNPVQRLSRDILVGIARLEKARRFCEPFAGIGIRSLRLFLEAGIEEAVVNDINPKHARVAREILRGFPARVYNEDASRLMPRLEPCDLVDLDQFGPPRRYIDAAIMLTRPNGVLSFIIPSPTDLFGRYPKKCLRIYGSYPVTSAIRFERGARIAMLKLSRHAAALGRHVEPLLVYRHKYYLRFVVRVRRGERNPRIRRISYDDIGFEISEEPVYARRLGGPARGGNLRDPEYLAALIGVSPEKRLLARLLEESQARPLYYDVHALSGKLKRPTPKAAYLEEKGFVRTHFYEYGFRAPSLEELVAAIIDRPS